MVVVGSQVSDDHELNDVQSKRIHKKNLSTGHQIDNNTVQ